MTKLEICLIITIIMLIFLSVPNFLMPALPKFRAALEQILAQGSSPATPLHQIISEVRNRKGAESGLPNFEELIEDFLWWKPALVVWSLQIGLPTV